MSLPCRDILLATANPSKIREMVPILEAAFEAGPAPHRWRTLADLIAPPPEPEETGETFLANARLKAVYYSRHAGMWAIADDSGLEVDALGGQPGIHSARFAGLNHAADRKSADAANNRKLIDLLCDIPAERRTARFRCAVVLAAGETVLAEAEGAVEGRIIDSPRGAGGFGYDPHFLIDELGRTTAELPAEEKNRLSHRARALRRLAAMMHDHPAVRGGAA